jgi:hypothetical protein
MRSGVRDEKLERSLSKALDNGLGIAESTVDRNALDKLGYWKADGKGAPPELATTAEKLHIFVGTIKPGASRGDVEDALKAYLGSLPSASSVAWKPLKDAQKNIQDLIENNPLEKFTSGDKLCERLGSDAVAGIKRKKLLILENIRSWEAEITRLLEPDDWSKKKVIEALQKEIEELLVPVFDAASQDVGDLRKGVEDARAMLRDTQNEISQSLLRAGSRLDEFQASYNRDKPWSPDRVASFSAKLEAMLASVQGDVLSAIEELRSRCATELTDSTQALGGHISDAVDALRRNEMALLLYVPNTDALRQLVKQGEDNLDNFDRLSKQLAEVRAKAEKISSAPLKAKALAAIDGLRSGVDALKIQVESGLDTLDKAEQLGSREIARFTQILNGVFMDFRSALISFSEALEAVKEVAGELLDAGFDEVSSAAMGLIAGPIALTRQVADFVKDDIQQLGQLADPMVSHVRAALQGIIGQADLITKEPYDRLDAVAEDIESVLASTRDFIAPETLLKDVLLPQVFRPAIVRLLEPYPEDLDKHKDKIRDAVHGLSYDLTKRIEALDTSLLDSVEALETACKALSGDIEAVYDYLKDEIGKSVERAIRERSKEFDQLIKEAKWDAGEKLEDAEALLKGIKGASAKVRAVHNDLSRSYESARVYGDRVLEQAGRLTSGGVTAVPNNIIKLYSAATSSPEIAALKANTDRLRANFDELNDIIDITRNNALFNKLGDDLKALGISFPVEQWSDQLLPVDLQNFDIGKVLNNFGGIDLKGLFKNLKMPDRADEVIKISSDFDKKQLRAWVQADLDVPLPKRSTVFSVGVFKFDFVRSRMQGKVKLEASEDTDVVQQTGHAVIDTNVEAIVSGQTMVTIEKVGLRFTREDGLEVELDPKNIRLNPAFQFIQDTLGTLFADEVGGMRIVKEYGVPVGVEHSFSIPPISLMFGTSGVSNIQISNRFALVAFPDFVIGNRFNLSRQDMPFIFSIFILGGTGYIQVDTEYRPTKSELSVMVSAAAGASAALGFSFGVISGSVYITLSVVVSYRKVIGRSGGGLSVGNSLLVAGNVRVGGIATVYITLLLNMTYRDNGSIDATGTLTVTVKISRWFKIRARARADYQLRGGVSRTRVSTETQTEIENEKLKKAKRAAERLSRARG